MVFRFCFFEKRWLFDKLPLFSYTCTLRGLAAKRVTFLTAYKAAFFVWSQDFSVLHSFLFWCDSTPFFIGLDKVAAIKESGFLSNIIQIIIRVQQEILCFVQANILDILLTGKSLAKLE